MTWPIYIASRQEYDAERERSIRTLYADNPAQAEQVLERDYPLTVAQAIDELRRRGLDACEASFPRFCDLESLRRIGRSYLLYKADVDAVAERMAEANALLTSATHRRAMGIGYAQEAEVRRELMHRHYGKVAAEVGVSLAELFAGIRCGLPNPAADSGFDVAQAKAWFAAHHDDSEFVLECCKGVMP